MLLSPYPVQLIKTRHMTQLSILIARVPRNCDFKLNTYYKALMQAPIIDRMTKRQGKIIASSYLNIQPHEIATARSIADIGYDVEFVPRKKGDKVKSADFVADGVLWEVKSPTSSQLRVAEKRLREAVHQSRDIVFDSRRMKHLSDKQIQNEVEKLCRILTSIRRLLYVNRNGEVVRIK